MAGLKSKDPAARRQAANQLGEIRARGAVRALTTLSLDSEPSVREAALFALGQIADPAAKHTVVRALSDKVADVRASAAFALGMLADKSAAQALSDTLDDSEPSVRGAAAAALGLLHDEAALDELIDLLNDDSFDVRYDAVWALGQIGDPDAAEYLRAALATAPGRTTSEGLRESFREAVQNALEDIKAQAAASSGDKPVRPRRASADPGQQQSHAGRGPAVRQSVLPAPTEDAIRSNISGAVGLRVLVGTGGRAVRAYVTKRVGFGLDRRAVQAALEYGYDAGLRDGLVQTDWLDLQVRFSAR
jgi:HEAT repeat protein